MSEAIDRAALIAEAKRMSLYVQRGGPDDGTVYDRLAVALAQSEREIAAQVATIEAARTWARWPFEGNNKGSEPNWDALDRILEVR